MTRTYERDADGTWVRWDAVGTCGTSAARVLARVRRLPRVVRDIDKRWPRGGRLIVDFDTATATAAVRPMWRHP